MRCNIKIVRKTTEANVRMCQNALPRQRANEIFISMDFLFQRLIYCLGSAF